MVRVTVNFDVDLLQMEHPFTGKLVYVNAAGISMIFLNDFQANEDLINMRGDKYTDKPQMTMLNELCNGKYLVGVYLTPLPTPLHFVLATIHRSGRSRASPQATQNHEAGPWTWDYPLL